MFFFSLFVFVIFLVFPVVSDPRTTHRDNNYKNYTVDRNPIGHPMCASLQMARCHLFFQHGVLMI